MHAPKRTQKVSHCRPNAFNGVSVGFVNTITVFVSRPLAVLMVYLLAVLMADDHMGAVNAVIPTPPICIHGGCRERK